MLWTLFASALLLAGHVSAQCSGGTGKTQSGNNNYVVDYFTGLLFTYAIDQCTAVDLASGVAWYKYTCSQQDSKWWITKTAYTSNDCSGTGDEVDSWSEDEVEEGQMGYFKCDGENHYAQVHISIDPECAAVETVAGGLGACAQNPLAFDTKFYCDASSALVQLYRNPTTFNETAPMCDDTALFCDKWTFGSTCAQAATFNGMPLYGKLVKCDAATDSSSTSAPEDAATSQFSLLGIAIALVAGFFWVH